MQELALYRKYRPQKFGDVIGQDHVIGVLDNAAKEGRIAHAYLFAGSRGTGKTSIARIFARAIGTSANDLYEMDAASNRGIDDVRAIREGVSSMPFDSKYKVYIIDEVHMLTKEAFNALLKTLEEPPSHVIFILATTEFEKLPDTIVSRCQTFQFKKPNQRVLRETVLSVAKKEGYTLEASSADLIALLAEGSFRDALGVLQKVIDSTNDKKITLAEVSLVLGAPRSALVHEFIESIALSEPERGLDALRQASEANIDMRMYMKMILEKIRYILLARLSSVMERELQDELSEHDFAFISCMKKEGKNIKSDTVVELLNAYERLGYAYMPELPIELALMRLAGKEEKAA